MISVIYNLYRKAKYGIIFGFTTVTGRVKAILAGVNLGKGVKFFGSCYIQKSRSAILKIGANSSFRSHPISNLIGVNRPCILSVGSNAKLVIGKNCGFSGTVIGCFEQITLENNVRCGSNTLITDSDWHLDDLRSGNPSSIYLERNVWLGVNVTVMKGVRIGENTVIGAGSIVTKNIPPNVIAAGNPCKVLRPLRPSEIKVDVE